MNVGDVVVVRAYGRKPLRRVVCGWNRRVVHVCRPDLFRDFQSGTGGAVGFPNDDVFEFSGDLDLSGNLDWDSLTHYARG